MKQLLALLLLLPVAATAGYSPPLEYGVATTITFDLYNTDGTLDVDEVDSGTEVTLYCDEAAGATATNDFVDEGPYYSLALTAAEMQCARLVVSVGATDTNNIHIWTIGSASAQVDDDGGWFDAVPWNSAWDAEAQSEATDALNAYDPPTDAEMDARTLVAASYFDPAADTVDIGAISGDTVAANNAESFFDGTGYAGTNNVIPTVTTLTGHTAQTGDSYARLGAPAGASHAADLLAIDNFVDNLESRLGTPSNFGSGTSTIAANLEDLADNGTATYDRSTDSLQAVRDRGDAAWTTGAAGSGLTALASGTAQGGTGTTIQLAAAETFADDILNTAVVKITGGTGAGQSNLIVDYTSTTDTATVADTWVTNPDATSTYEIVPGSVNVAGWNGAAVTSDVQTAADIRAEIDSNSTQLAAIVADTNELQTDDIPGRLTGIEGSTFATGTDSLEAIRDRGDAAWTTGAGGSAPTVEQIRTEMDTNSTQLAAIVADTNELQTDDYPTTLGTLATAAALATVDTNVDSIVVDTGTTIPAQITGLNDLDAAGIRGAVGLASANLDTQIAALPTAAEIWDIQCEDQNGGYSCRETMSLLLAEAMGTCTYTAGTRTFVCSDPSGTETRFTLVYGSELDGDRTTSTPSPFTP